MGRYALRGRSRQSPGHTLPSPVPLRILPALDLLFPGLNSSQLWERCRTCLNEDALAMGLSLPHLEPEASMVYGYLTDTQTDRSSLHPLCF